MITDRRHLRHVATQLVSDVASLQEAWLEEDAAACAPRSGGLAVASSGGLPSDPTGRAADLNAKYRDRDDIGRTLLELSTVLRAWVAAR